MVTQKTSLSSPATDPLRNFKFQVILTPLNATGAGGGGTSITLGFMTVQGLAANIDSIPYREGNMNTVTQQMPGQTSFNPITLSHGVICGQTGGPLEVNMLQQIFTVNQGSGTQAPGMNFRYKADIQVLDHPVTTQDAPVKAWFIVHNAWTTAFAWGDLDAGANQTLVAQLSMVHEGFDVSYAAGVGTSAASAPDTLQ